MMGLVMFMEPKKAREVWMAGELITAVFKIGVSLIGHAVGGVNIPGL